MSYEPQHEQPWQPEQPQWQQPAYPAAQPQQQPPPYPMPPAKQPRRILGLPLWGFLTLVGLVCCGGPGVLLGVGAVLSAADEAAEPEPTVSCTVTAVDDGPDAVLPSAEVEWQITNPGEDDGFWVVNIAILDAAGRTVGEVSDGGFGVEPGATEVDTVTVYLDAAGAETCQITVS